MNEVTGKTFGDYLIESGADSINAGSLTSETLNAAKHFNLKIKQLPAGEKLAMQEELKELFKQKKVPGAHNLLRLCFKEDEKKKEEEEIPENYISPNPWPEPVNGDELFHEICALINGYIILSDGGVETIVLYVFSSYFLDCYDLFPYLHITSASKGCGKSKLLEIVERLVPVGDIVVNPSPASLFRMVDKYGMSICMDEVDQGLKNEDILAFLVAAYRKKQAEGFTRCNEKGELIRFSAWGVKVLAGIGELKIDTLRDRTIKVPLVKKRSREKIKRLRTRQLEELTIKIRQKLIRFAQDHSEAMNKIMSAGPKMPGAFQSFDRPAENWEPLIASGDLCSEELGQMARRIAILSLGVKTLERQSHGEELLKDFMEIFVQQPYGIHSKDFVEILNGKEDRPWAGWNKGFGIKPHNISALMGPFGIKPKNIMMGGAQLKGYHPDDFTDVFDRYFFELDGNEKAEPSTPNPLESNGVTGEVDGWTANSDTPPLPTEEDDLTFEEEPPF